MTAQVFHGVPIPKRSGGPSTEGLYSRLQNLPKDGMLFVEGGTSRSTSATVARVAKNLGRKFTSRKVARVTIVYVAEGDPKAYEIAHAAADEPKAYRIVDSGTPNAIEGIGIWRVA